MELFLSVLVGVSLAAASGFRVFVPLWFASVAAFSGHVTLAPDFAWLGTLPALIAFSVATVAEIVAYKVPYFDHLLDLFAVPAAAIAGALLVGSFTTDLSPMLRWSLALVGGSAVSGTIAAGMATVRGASTLSTAGLGNPLVATAESGTAIAISLLAVLAPLLGVLAFVVLGVVWARRRRVVRG